MTTKTLIAIAVLAAALVNATAEAKDVGFECKSEDGTRVQVFTSEDQSRLVVQAVEGDVLGTYEYAGVERGFADGEAHVIQTYVTTDQTFSARLLQTLDRSATMLMFANERGTRALVSDKVVREADSAIFTCYAPD